MVSSALTCRENLKKLCPSLDAVAEPTCGYDLKATPQ
jgi:hypothetical protein